MLAVLAAWLVASWTSLIVTVDRNYVPGPIWDYWMTVFHLDRYFRLDITALWEQHNEHRVIFPELAFIADYRFFHGREILPIVLNVLLLAGTASLFARVLYTASRVPRNVAIAGGLLCGILMSWHGLSYLLSAPFLVQWTMYATFTALAFHSLSRARLAMAILFGAAATYSSANGLAIWPLLLLAAFWLRLSLRRIIALAAAGAIFSALFFVGYQKGSSWRPEDAIHHPLYWARYIGVYLGMPFSLVKTSFGIAIAWLGIVFLAWLLWRLHREDLRGEPIGVVFPGCALMSCATVFLTSLARMNLEDADIENVKAGRYMLVPIVFWASLLMAGIWLVSRARPRASIALLSAVALFLAISLPVEANWADKLNDEYSRSQIAWLSVEAGLQDPALLTASLYPNWDFPPRFMNLLRLNNLSIYSDTRYRWIGRHFDTPPQPAVRGGVVSSKPITGGVELLGWVAADAGVNEFLFLDNTGRAVGLGECPRAGLPRALLFPLPENAKAWAAFVSLESHPATIHAWGWNSSRTRLFPLGNEIRLN